MRTAQIVQLQIAKAELGVTSCKYAGDGVGIARGAVRS